MIKPCICQIHWQTQTVLKDTEQKINKDVNTVREEDFRKVMQLQNTFEVLLSWTTMKSLMAILTFTFLMLHSKCYLLTLSTTKKPNTQNVICCAHCRTGTLKNLEGNMKKFWVAYICSIPNACKVFEDLVVQTPATQYPCETTMKDVRKIWPS